MLLLHKVEEQDHLLTWAADRLGAERWSAEAFAIGIYSPSANALRGVIVIEVLSERHCQAHFASDGSRQWANRSVFDRLCRYLFVFRGFDRATGIVPAVNTDMILTCIRTGWQIDGRLRCGAPDGSDAILFSMLRRECPHLTEAERNGEGSS